MSRPRVIVPLLASLLLLGACGSSDAEPDAAPSTTEAVEAIPDTWALTGLPSDGADTTVPTLVVKIDNTTASAPQRGLGDADIVVEEMVEGGTTRLAAMFQSSIPDVAGPVRSIRATDLGIVPSDGDAVVVTSGGAWQTLQRFREAEVPFFEEGAPGFYRDQDRSAPYNLMVELPTLDDEVETDGQRPDDYLPWSEDDAVAADAGEAASSVEARFSGGRAAQWAYADGSYSAEDDFAAEGEEFAPDSLLTLRVEVVDAGYSDAAGNFVPESVLEGTGEATLFHSGRAIAAEWSKEGGGPLTLSTADGELRVPPGRTWIGLIPVDGGSVEFD